LGLILSFFYTFKRKSFLGGKYGTNLNINYSQVNSISKESITYDPSEEFPNLDGYTSNFFAIGDELYFRDFSVELHKKISKKFKFTAMYMYEDFNRGIIQGKDSLYNANIGVLDMTYKISSTHALRLETQAIFVTDDMNEEVDYGNWYGALLEYTFAPKWFIALTDQYNTGHGESEAVHYYNFSGGYINGATRIQLGYGRQREGVICIGGVCRVVPAASGFNLTISSTF
jgi:hypothetical protein